MSWEGPVRPGPREHRSERGGGGQGSERRFPEEKEAVLVHGVLSWHWSLGTEQCTDVPGRERDKGPRYVSDS